MKDLEYKPNILEKEVKEKLEKDAKLIVEAFEKLNRKGRRLLSAEQIGSINFARTILSNKKNKKKNV